MRTAVLALTALLLTACGSAGQEDAGVPGNGVPPRYGAACPDAATVEGPDFSADDELLPRLGSQVVPAGLLRCTVEVRDIAGEGQWSVLVGSWADSDLDAFVAALRQPDEKPGDGGCPAMLVLTPWFVLVTNDGHLVRARLPDDVCGQPQSAALEALAALPYSTVSETRVRQLETPEAQAAGCPQQWKDMVAIVAADGSSARAAERSVLPVPTPSKVLACLYRSDGTPPDQTPGGEFVSGRTLAGREAAAALADVESARGAPPCEERAATFVVLQLSTGGTLTVESGGCRRMLTDAGELRAAPASLLQALDW